MSSRTHENPGNPTPGPRDYPIVIAYAVAAIVLTWPLAYSPGLAISARPDYYINLWNLWWTGESVLAGTSPYWTDLLHFPNGVSLARHTLSPGNSIPGALIAKIVGHETAFEWLLLTHFWLSACTAFFLAREVSGSFTGAFLAGLLWAYSPFHAHYLAQINIATLEFLPLVVLFLLRMRRDGGTRNAIGICLCVAGMAATSWYYLVYAGILGVLIAVLGFLEDRETPFIRATLRLAIAGAAAGLVALAIGWPLISESASAPPGPDVSVEDYTQRSNDLLGFHWVGPPEVAIVSWPTMLGWSALAIVLLGWRGLRKRGFWIATLLIFFVLGLGPELSVGGKPTGLALPYAWLDTVPVLSMLRKPDRFQIMMQLAWMVIVACCWSSAAASMSSARRRLLFPVFAVLIALELKPGPLETFDSTIPQEVSQLVNEPGAIVHLPAKVGHGADSLSNLWQTVHGRPIPQGYVTSLALSPAARADGEALESHWKTLQAGRAQPLLNWLRKRDVSTVVLHSIGFDKRRKTAIDGRTVWTPFPFARKELLHVRQSGPFELRPIPRSVRTARRALEDVLGDPFLDTDAFAAFRISN